MDADRRLQLFEFALWVAVASVVTVVVGLAAGLLVGGSLRAGKLALFVLGFLLFGVGSVAIQPSGPDLSGSVYDTEEDTGRRSLNPLSGGPAPGGESSVTTVDDGGTNERGFEARLQEVGPLSDHHLPPERRVSRGAKVFATSIVVLAVSFLMEVAGVQV